MAPRDEPCSETDLEKQVSAQYQGLQTLSISVKTATLLMFSCQTPDSIYNHIERNQAIALSSAESEALAASSRKYRLQIHSVGRRQSVERLIRRRLALLDPAHLPFRKPADLRKGSVVMRGGRLRWQPGDVGKIRRGRDLWFSRSQRDAGLRWIRECLVFMDQIAG